MLRASLIVALTLLVAGVATAAPEVSVHARTEIRLKPIRKDHGGYYIVSGTLVDRFSGAAISYQRVTLTIAGQTVSAATDDDGTFTMRVPAPGGHQDLEVKFEGGDLLDPSAVRLDDVDIDKNPVDLSITTSAETGAVRITVTATSAGAPIALPVELQVSPAGAPDELAKVATVTANAPPFVLTRAAAGGPGSRRVRAVFAGDSLYNPARADATIELATETTTSLSVKARSVAFEDDLVATGQVLDDDQQGVARAAVALFDRNDRRVTQTTTGPDGKFRFKVEGRAFGQGENRLQAVLEPTEGWMRQSHSDVVDIEVAAPQPVPVAYTLAAFAATALVAGGFFFARNRPWQRLRRAAPVDRERPPGDAPAEPAGGLVLARPSLVSTLRRPGDHGVAGMVRDAIRHRPLAGARVVVTMAGVAEGHDAVVGPDGTFAFEGLMAGDWRAEVSRAGHVTERFAMAIPHRGELRGARIDLMPVRERIFSMYKRAAVPLLPDPGRWGVWSPRQIFDHVRKKSAAPALAELTDYVEAAYFSARLPDEDALAEASQRVDRALREQARPNSMV